jgi:hypothetical protein
MATKLQIPIPYLGIRLFGWQSISHRALDHAVPPHFLQSGRNGCEPLPLGTDRSFNPFKPTGPFYYFADYLVVPGGLAVRRRNVYEPILCYDG